jgi:adenylate cyclase
MAHALRWWKRVGRRTSECSSARHQRGLGLAILAMVVVVSLLAVSHMPPWRLVDARIFDYLSTLAAPPRPEAGPVIVAIDEPSFAEIGLRWPWPRDIHAELVKALRGAGARAIGLDIIFSEPGEELADALLANVLGPDVVLAADETLIETAHADHLIRVEPLEEFTRAGALPGVVAISLDEDGVLRRIPSYPDGFARRLLAIAGAGPTPPSGQMIQSFGGPRSYPTASYYQALEPARFLPEGYFRDRVVIVGLSLQNAPTTDQTGADAYQTSNTIWNGRLLSGAEIQATIFDNLSSGFGIHVAHWSWKAFFLAGSALLAVAAVSRGTGWHTILVVAGAVVLLAAVSFLMLRFGRVYLPPLAPAVAFVLVAAGQSARDFADERRLRQSITRAFSQYLSPVLVERLASDPAGLKLGGESKVLTVLFSDVRGFTSIAEGMKDEPERLITLINRLLDPLSQQILEEGGTIDKYMGDCVMAFWNAPLDEPDHAMKAVRAGLRMRKALEMLNAELAAESPGAPLRLDIGIGINTGPCIVGNMGSQLRFDYSAVGDTVNRASRLEGKTRDYDVPLLIGPETARQLDGRMPVLELDRTSLRGMSEIVPILTVVPDATPEAVAEHGRVLDDHYAGNLSPDDLRLEWLAANLPSLASYYLVLSHRASRDGAAMRTLPLARQA